MKFLKSKNQNRNSVPDEFKDTLEDLMKQIDQVDSNNLEINRLMLIILNETNLEKIEASKAALNDKIEENKKLGKRIRSILKQENDNTADTENTDPNRGNESKKRNKLIRKNQMNTQSRRFYGLWMKHNEQMDEYKTKLKELFRRQCRIANRNDLTDQDIETMLSEGNFEMFANLGEIAKATQELRDLETRHAEFVKLENSIQEVYELFIELSTMVEDQGNALDVIEMNMESTMANAKEGTENLGNARRKKKRTRKMKIVSGAVVSIVIAVVIVIVAV